MYLAYDVPLYRVSLSENLVHASYRQKFKLHLGLFVVVYKLVIVALTWERHTVYQCTKSYRQKT